MEVIKLQLLALFCLQSLILVRNETFEYLMDKSISNLQKIRLKLKFLSVMREMYGNCMPCRPISKSTICDCTAASPMKDCLEFLENGFTKNGIYKLNEKINVYCDQTTQGGGWTVFLRRQDGSTNFAQNWMTYKYGFGKLTSEFWLGNEIVHDLTKPSAAQNKSELLINRGDKYTYAKYNTFELGDEGSKYILKISGPSGNVTSPESISAYHNNMKFSTYDQDNDNDSRHCSNSFGGVGWWFDDCYRVLLTENTGTFVEMKFRRKV